MNALILPGFQAIYVEEVFVGVEEGNLLHLLIRKTHEPVDVACFHDRHARHKPRGPSLPLRVLCRHRSALTQSTRSGSDGRRGFRPRPGYCRGNSLAEGTISWASWTRCGWHVNRSTWWVVHNSRTARIEDRARSGSKFTKISSNTTGSGST